jgi:hypothetical protein
MSVLFCYNCYQTSHIAKQCPNPVSSYGIVCYFINNDIIKYCIAERKHTFAFFDFLKGNYNLYDPVHLQLIFNRMTLLERCLISNKYGFKHLWLQLWNIKDSAYKQSIRNEFCKGSIKFYILKNGFKSIKDNIFYQLSDFIEKCTDNYKSPECYFPKGKKKNKSESSIQCAIREFIEETHLLRSDFEIENTFQTFNEYHIGDNKKTYISIFFIGKYIGPALTKNKEFFRFDDEIDNIEWMTYDECVRKFRPYETSKIKLMEIIKNYHTK